MTARKIRLIAVLVLVGVAIVIGLSGIYRVNEGEKAVVLTFGEVSDTKDPGMYWHLPMIQEVRMQSTTKVYTEEYGYRTDRPSTGTSEPVYHDVPEEAIMLTDDQNIVSVEAVYQVYVKDVVSFFYEVEDPFNTMRCSFETVLRRNLQNRTLDDALLNKQDISGKVLEDFRKMLAPYNLGVDIKEVMIQNISVPEEVKAAYEDVNNAMNEKTRKLDEAEKYKNQVVPNARAQAYKMRQDAEAYKARTVANAEGEVAEFREVYSKYVNSKEITRTRLMIEALENILGNARQVYIMDEDSGALKMLTLNGNNAAPTATPAPLPAAPEGGN